MKRLIYTPENCTPIHCSVLRNAGQDFTMGGPSSKYSDLYIFPEYTPYHLINAYIQNHVVDFDQCYIIDNFKDSLRAFPIGYYFGAKASTMFGSNYAKIIYEPTISLCGREVFIKLMDRVETAFIKDQDLIFENLNQLLHQEKCTCCNGTGKITKTYPNIGEQSYRCSNCKNGYIISKYF